MGAKSGGSPQTGWWHWGLVAGVASTIAVGAVPAIAAELAEWGYDPQTRSLTLVLPESAIPAVSVITPTQLSVELPDTQLGAVAALTVEDGLVESIVLEQTTADTVRMVVEFAPGTVLASSQSATPVAVSASVPPGSQRWQVQPDILASSPLDDSAQFGAAGTADALSSSAAALAQTPDFSDLPVLESAMPADELVSVPPLEAAPPPPIEAARPAISLPSIAPTAEEMPALETDPVAAEMPTEPPFIGEVGLVAPPPDLSIDQPVMDDLLDEEMTAAADETVAEPEEVIEAVLPAPTEEIIEAAPPALPEETAEPEVSVEVAEAAAIAPPIPTSVETETTADSPAAAPIVNVPTEAIRPANVSRWPEPIPFGQPLP